MIKIIQIIVTVLLSDI